MTSSPPPAKQHALLWTSGWDSTFRLLDLLHSTDATVQPHYLYSVGRKSVALELKAIHEILLRIAQVPEWKGRVLTPLIRIADQYRYAGTVYEESLHSILKRVHLGTQYMYLAIFRDVEKYAGLELSLVKGEGAAYRYLREWVGPDESGSGALVLSKEAPEDVQILFRGYHFPLMYTSKLDMARIAEEKGFSDLLNMSWFCHSPLDGAPCGTCRPCMVTMRNGLSHRLGEAGLARYHAAQAEEAAKAAAQPSA